MKRILILIVLALGVNTIFSQSIVDQIYNNENDNSVKQVYETTDYGVPNMYPKYTIKNQNNSTVIYENTDYGIPKTFPSYRIEIKNNAQIIYKYNDYGMPKLYPTKIIR